MNWTRTREAAALLASIAANPPSSRMVRHDDLTTYWKREYTGSRVRALRSLWKAARAAALDTPEFADIAFHDEQKAIAEVLEPVELERKYG